jgi:beta-phosphoglucomutase
MPRMQLGVIFDVDGVLIDSYEAHFESWQIVAPEFGAMMTREEFAKGFGRTSREIIKDLWPGRFSDERILQFDQAKESAYRDILRSHFPEMRGAAELMQSLHDAGFKIALGSSGPKENVAIALQKLTKANLISASVDGSQVTRGKPDPEVFLLAASKLGIDPKNCAVIEDAPAGLEAARRAGTATVALTGTASREQLAQRADLVVESLSELSPALIQNLIQRNQK